MRVLGNQNFFFSYKSEVKYEQKRLLCEEKGIKVIYFSDKKYNENILTNLNEILDVIKND